MMKVLKFEDFLLESKKTGKKTLFISFTEETRGVNYNDYINSKINADFCLWADLVFDGGEILLKENPLSNYGFVFIGVVSKHPDYFVSVEEYLKLNKNFKETSKLNIKLQYIPIIHDFYSVNDKIYLIDTYMGRHI